MKNIVLLCITALMFVSITSCSKFPMSENNDISNTEEVVNVTLKANEIYKYTLSEATDVNNIEISTPSAKSAIAIVESNGTNNNFVYTPDASFSGTDVVVISHNPSNTSKRECGLEDSRKNNQPQKGKCIGNEQKSSSNCSGNNSCASNKSNCRKQNQNTKHKIIFNITVLSKIN